MRRDRAGIFVAVCVGTGRIVGSVRVFQRTVQAGDDGATQLAMGGLGEVGTLPAWRKKGIATHLLKMAIAYMQKKQLAVSGLHAASAAANIYRRLGWRAASMPMCTVPLGLKQSLSAFATAKSTGFNDHLKAVLRASTKELRFDEATMQRLAPVYSNFSKSMPGSMVRTREYWRAWITNPAEGFSVRGVPGAEEEVRCIRGWEITDAQTGVTTAYVMVKAAKTTSQAVEGGGGDGTGRTLNVVDFAMHRPMARRPGRGAPLTSRIDAMSEQILLYLLGVASDEIFGPDAQDVHAAGTVGTLRAGGQCVRCARARACVCAPEVRTALRRPPCAVDGARL